MSDDTDAEVVIVCNDGELKAPVYVLLAASPVARGMLKTDMAEKNTMRINSEFSCSDFSAFLRCIDISRGAREQKLDKNNICPVFRLSHFWQVDALVQESEKVLLQLTKETPDLKYLKGALDIAQDFKNENLVSSCFVAMTKLPRQPTEMLDAVILMKQSKFAFETLIPRESVADANRWLPSLGWSALPELKTSMTSLYNCFVRLLAKSFERVDSSKLKDHVEVFEHIFKAVQAEKKNYRYSPY